jgi:hypothetical protein
LQVQLHRDRFSIEDASREWDRNLSSYIKVATLRIPNQHFIDGTREELSERLAFNVGHSLRAHKPLGAMNRARVHLYKALANFRWKRAGRQPVDPTKAFEETE